ncbi:integrase [Pelomonas sp. UHG3]|uniref:Integrase n=1 Tax=Roseateles hydrophilus TaxID=2975054 RepID=A0ACC6CBI7_9BURK|nr:integrase [Pelomonas sp. UHG3]MCY4745699.1 integrase [Pelomonas sp. UHG3]
MSSSFYLRKDQRIFIDAAEYTVVRADHAGETMLESSASGLRQIYTAYQLVQMYTEGRVATASEQRAQQAPDLKRKRPPARMDGMSARAKAETRRRLDILIRVDNANGFSMSREDIEVLLRDIARDRKDPFPPHVSTVYRWRRKYEKAQRDVRALFSCTDERGGRGVSRLGPEVDQKVDEVIDELVLARHAFSPQEVQEAVKLRIDLLNKERSQSEQLTAPSLRTIQRRIASEGLYDLLVARVGMEEALRRFSVRGAARRVGRILEMVEIDHTPVDLLVVGEDRQVIGRPTLTVVLCRKSRACLGYCLSLAGHGVPTVFAALRHALLPKDYLAERYGDLNLSWPMHGWFERIVMDNGREFHADAIADALLSLGIAVEFAASKSPNDKPHIERFLRTLNYGLIHTLKGTTLAKVHHRVGFKSEDEAVLTLDELDRIIHVWICNVYHQRPHRGLAGKTPLEVWNSDVLIYPPQLKMSPQEVDYEFADVEEKPIHHYGIEINTYKYNCAALQDLRKALPMGAKVHVKWPRWNVGHIFVWNSISQAFITVPNNREDLKGLSLDQAQAVKEAESAPRRDLGVVAGRGSETIRKLEKEAAEATQLKNRRKSGRLGQHTSDKSRGIAPEPVPVAPMAEEADNELVTAPDDGTEFDEVEMEVVS